MAKNELRGASRRQFIKGAFAIGAALGWGPSRILDFIARGAGEAAAAQCGSSRIQNLVILNGSSGAHGYPHLLFPYADSYADPTMGSGLGSASTRYGGEMATHFMQSTSATGAVPAIGSSLIGTTAVGTVLTNTTDYSVVPARASRGSLGAWAPGERFKRVFGVDNQGFGGFHSDNPTSQAFDQAYYSSTTVPSNLSSQLTKDKKFIVASRETPWLDKYGIKKAITSIEGGVVNGFHVTAPHNHYIDFDKRWSVMAAAAAIQLTRPTITPVILIGNMAGDEGNGTTSQTYGVAGSNLPPGAPTPALVADASGMVGLFNSNAAKIGGALTDPNNATLFQAYVNGAIGNSKTASLPTYSGGYGTAKLSANLVGLNLAGKLSPTVADQVRYGFTATQPAIVTQLRDNLIVTAKALALGLTSQVVISYYNDDPHDLFSATTTSAPANAAAAAAIFGNFLDAFMDDLMAVDDPFCAGTKLGDNTVILFIGDVPRTGISKSTWQDPNTGLQNRAWMMTNGFTKTGFFGGERAMINGQGDISGNNPAVAGAGEGGFFDTITGDMIKWNTTGGNSTIMYNGSAVDLRRRYGEIAMGAALYAVAGGDIRNVNNYFNANKAGMPNTFSGVLVPVII